MAFRIFSVAMIRAGTLIPGLKDGSMSQIASETFRNSGFLNAPFSAGSPMLHLRRQGRMRQHRCTPTAFDTSLFLCNPIFPMLSRVQEREAPRLRATLGKEKGRKEAGPGKTRLSRSEA